MVVDLGQSGLGHHALQGFLVRVHADRLREIAIAGGILGHGLAHARQNLEGIEVVERRQRFPDLGELQHHQPATRLEHAPHLAQGGLLVGHVAQAEGDRDQIEIVVREGQLLGIALCHRQHHAFVEQTVAADAEHGTVDVGEPNLAGRPRILGQ